MQINGIVQLSSVYNICAIKSMILLEMKCPQLSKPEATAVLDFKLSCVFKNRRRLQKSKY